MRKREDRKDCRRVGDEGEVVEEVTYLVLGTETESFEQRYEEWLGVGALLSLEHIYSVTGIFIEKQTWLVHT